MKRLGTDYPDTVRSASFILLQAVPSTISLTDLREDIQSVKGVLSVHELHVWQLSEVKIVASVHVWVSRKREYMRIAREIRRVLHDHGIHSSTIQPEFHDDSADGPPEEHLIVRVFFPLAYAALLKNERACQTDQETHCLIPCPPDRACPPETACCRTFPSHPSYTYYAEFIFMGSASKAAIQAIVDIQPPPRA